MTNPRTFGTAGFALALALVGVPAEAAPTTPPLGDAVASTCTGAEPTTPDAEASAEELNRRAACAEAEGHFIAAVKLYQLALRRSPPPPLARRLQTKSSELVGKLASVRIEPGSLPDGAKAIVASKEYELGTKRYVDPGKVKVEVSAPGYVPRVVTFDLKEGEERPLNIVLSPVAIANQVPPETVPPSQGEPRSNGGPPPAVTVVPPASFNWRPIGYATLAVGGAALVVGGVTGFLALDSANEVRKECPTRTTCSAEGAEAARSGSTLSTVSTVTTIAGAALALGGLALVIWGGPKTAVRPSVGFMNGLLLTHEL